MSAWVWSARQMMSEHEGSWKRGEGAGEGADMRPRRLSVLDSILRRKNIFTASRHISANDSGSKYVPASAAAQE